MTKAIVIPYRDRKQHLERFLEHYQGIDIFIVEQFDQKPFNRAKLFNVWFQEYGLMYDYFITHDVDMYLDFSKSDMSVYDYPVFPTHIATRCQQFGYEMPYPDYFGGVTIFSREHFIQVNGFSNEFWSWGGEDDEMLRNVKKFYDIHRREAYFECADHERNIDKIYHRRNVEYLKSGRSKNDGLSQCKYTIISSQNKHIKVEL